MNIQEIFSNEIYIKILYYTDELIAPSLVNSNFHKLTHSLMDLSLKIIFKNYPPLSNYAESKVKTIPIDKLYAKIVYLLKEDYKIFTSTQTNDLDKTTKSKKELKYYENLAKYLHKKCKVHSFNALVNQINSQITENHRPFQPLVNTNLPITLETHDTVLERENWLKYQHLEKFKTLTTLDLRSLSLVYLYQGLSSLTNLNNFEAGNNRLIQINPCLSALTNLTFLNLSGNEITNFPSQLTTLTSLKYLNLSNNSISQICDLPFHRLISLEMNSNKLFQISLGRFRYLTYLDLMNNRFTNLPEDLSKLETLRYLNVSHNQLKFLPDNLTLLTTLTSLNVSYNPLESFPENLELFSRLTRLEFKQTVLTTKQINAIHQFLKSSES